MTTATRSPHLSTGLSIAALAFFLDQLTKFVIVDVLTLERRGSIQVVEIFDLTWAENCGIALSLLSQCNDTTRWSLVALTGIVAIAVLVWMTREQANGDVAALALIFAVFLTNPAPICVLDEVDAPLDDHNIERFCDLLDAMTEATDTRFIIITHNPITMARMNRLYGVTMAERGVSQLVSVDLETAARIKEAV